MKRALPILLALATLTALLSTSSASAQETRPMCGGFFATIVGTEGNDVLIGTGSFDVIVGLGGNDIIRGRSGTDIICGGDGSDRLMGGPGDDWIYGGPRKDNIKGGPGFDQLFGEGGSDRLIGAEDADRLDGGGGPLDRLFGQDDRDLCFDPDATSVRRLCDEPMDTDTCDTDFLAPISLGGNGRVRNDHASGCPVIRGRINNINNNHTFELQTEPGQEVEIWVDWRLGDFTSGCPTLFVEGVEGEFTAGACRGASLRSTATGESITVQVGMTGAAGNYTLMPYGV